MKPSRRRVIGPLKRRAVRMLFGCGFTPAQTARVLQLTKTDVYDVLRRPEKSRTR